MRSTRSVGSSSGSGEPSRGSDLLIAVYSKDRLRGMRPFNIEMCRNCGTRYMRPLILWNEELRRSIRGCKALARSQAHVPIVEIRRRTTLLWNYGDTPANSHHRPSATAPPHFPAWISSIASFIAASNLRRMRWAETSIPALTNSSCRRAISVSSSSPSSSTLPKASA